MDEACRVILFAIIAIATLLAIAAAVWLPWWTLPFAGAGLILGIPLAAALVFGLRDARH